MADLIKNYFLQILISIDQLFNALLGGFADETLSARAFRAEQKEKFFGKIFRPLIDIIFFFDENHCFNAYHAEVQKRQFPRDYKY